MRVEWDNCFLCFNDLGGDGGGGRKRNVNVDEGKSELVLVLNYLLHTRFSNRGSNEVLETIKSLLDEFYLARASGKRKGTAISICERCKVDVVLVAELHQQLEVIQMRMVEVLKGLRRKVVECSRMQGQDGKGNLMEIFEQWLGTQKEEDVREQKRFLEGVKGFQNVVVANDKNFVDIPRVILDNLSNYRGQASLVPVPVSSTESHQIDIQHVIKTEKPDLENDMMDFDAPVSPVCSDPDYAPESVFQPKKEGPPKKKRKRRSVISQVRKKRKDPTLLTPKVKKEPGVRGRKKKIKPKTAKQEKAETLKQAPFEFTLKSHILRKKTPGGIRSKTPGPEGAYFKHKYLCRTCPFKTSFIHQFEHHLRVHEEELNALPVQEDPISPTEDSETVATATEFSCQECKRTFRCQQFYEFHMAGHFCSHELLCDVCQKKCSPFEIQEHMKSHSEQVFQCPNCSMWSSSRERYLEHLRLHTNSKCRHHCDLCGKVFDKRRTLLAHYGEDHPGTLATVHCEVEGCGKEFVRQDLLDEHYKNHHGNRNHLCTVCGRVLCSAYSLENHMLVHENKKPFACPHCTEAFTSKSSLNRHLIRQHGAPKFKCHLCENEYMDNATLKNHLRLHAGNVVSCDKCGKTFANQRCVDRHQTVHSDEKPIVCEICGQRFKDRSWIKNHMRIHEGDKRWKCQYCDKAFVFEDYLVQHVRIHTGEKPFVCEACGKGFNQYAGLYLHRKKCTSVADN